MAHFAIISPADAGHILPMGCLGKELTNRGHRVTILARAEAAPLAEQLGLPLYPLDMDDVRYSSSYLFWPIFHACGNDWIIIMRDFFSWHTEGILQMAPQALKALAIDGVLTDQIVPAGGTVAELAGVPFVTVCTAVMWNEELGVPPASTPWLYREGPWAQWRNRLGYAAWQWFIRPTLKIINRYRSQWQLPRLRRIDDTYSRLAQICQLCPELDYPRRRLPDFVHYVGSLAGDRKVKNNCQFPWDRLDGRRLIFASLGTIPDSTNMAVYQKILAACAGLDAQLVLALGKWSDKGTSVREQLGAIPENALVVDFAPQLALLDVAALLITHAGVNTVTESLGRSVPIVALPRSADQPAMAARVAYAGAGLVGSFRRSTPRQIRRLVERVLTEDAFRQRAKELQKALAAAGGVSRAADIAEQALSTRRPVRRQDVGSRLESDRSIRDGSHFPLTT